jgi:hypothetical protein
LLTLFEQRRLGIFHLSDQSANPIVKRLALPRQDLGFRRCKALVFPQIDDET